MLSIGFFSFQSKLLGDYKPGRLQDSSGNPLYQFGTIDSGDFCYPYWMSNYLTSLWKSAAIVRQTVVPTAMVDWRGDLFTMSLWGLSTSSGAEYMLKRYRATGNTISSNSASIFPWTLIGVSINTTETPSGLQYPNWVKWFNNYVNNVFQPCIAQDISDNGEVISMVWYVPATRHMGNDASEGLLYQVRNKNNLSSVIYSALLGSTEGILGQEGLGQYAWHHLKPRNYNPDKCVFMPEAGNFTAASMPPNPQNPNNCLTQVYYCGLLEYDNFEAGKIFNLRADCSGSTWYNVSGLRVYRRYIKWGDRCYGMCCLDGNRFVRIFSFFVGNGFSLYQKFTVEQLWVSAFGYIDHTNKSPLAHTAATENYTPYNYDFCIVKGNNGVGIMCLLGLRATGLTSDKTLLTSSYNANWNKISWGKSDICLMLSSCKIGSQPEFCYEDPQNMIYTTQKTSGTVCNVSCGCYALYYSGYGDNQLFKNTHKCCVYEAASGQQYIIYCYCYPGKSKQLYLGYAMCLVDSNNKVRLGPKYEFRSTADQWSDSFGLFTSCARIISMDCKNGHLWITWLNASDSQYHYFHIQAKDLVGE